MAQIGTVKLETQNNGTVDVPVFDTADAGSSVYDMVRVQAGSNVGFIPFVDTSTAAYPYLRVQSQNHGIVAAHNKAKLAQIIDSAEDGDVSEYSGVGADTFGDITTSNSRATDGSLSILIFENDGWYISTSGLNTYPQAGDTIKADVYPSSSDAGGSILFGCQSDGKLGSLYYVNYDYDGDLLLEKISDTGATTTLASTSATKYDGEWLSYTINWGSNGTIDATVERSNGDTVASITGSDTTYTDGGIGISTAGSNSNVDTYFDYIRKL